MKKKLLLTVAVFLLALAFYSPRDASAIPAFARQTGMACNTCHYQHFPELNSFGRSFKAGGFTMVGGQSLIEGDLLSIPSALNATIMAKAIFQQTYGNNSTGTASEFDNGTWSFPTDANLLVGGHIGKHAGFITEINLLQGDVSGTQTNPRMASLKIPFVFDAMDTQFNIIPYTTDGAGPSWSFEELNTGVVETHTPLLHKSESSAAQFIGVGQEATGIAFVAYRPIGYINYSMWSSSHGDFSGSQTHVGSPLHYLRVVATPNVAGWDLGIGAAAWMGTEKRGAQDAPTRQHANAWDIDAQALGNIADYPVGLYASYACAKKSKSTDAGDSNLFNTSTNKKKTAWSVLAELGIIPNRLTLSAAYRAGRNGDPNADGKDKDNATTIAATYSAAQNIQISLDQSWYSGNGKGDESASGYGAAGPGSLSTITVWAVF